jgi:3-phosphoshikimate 1-carboxyvinyltransferase
LLLAGLYAEGPTAVSQPGPARDHTERLLLAMGVAIETSGLTVTLTPDAYLSPVSIDVPGDFSSAAFCLVAAALLQDSEIIIQNVGINPTRTGLLDALLAMNADLTLKNQQQDAFEPTADLIIRSADLQAIDIGGDTVVRMIDEFPILAVAATQAQGITHVRDAGELRVKETDRIATVVSQLRTLGANIESHSDGFVVIGPTPLHGAVVDSHGDHRLAMALVVAGLIATGETVVQNTECIDDSFPGFQETLSRLIPDQTALSTVQGSFH